MSINVLKIKEPLRFFSSKSIPKIQTGTYLNFLLK